MESNVTLSPQFLQRVQKRPPRAWNRPAKLDDRIETRGRMVWSHPTRDRCRNRGGGSLTSAAPEILCRSRVLNTHAHTHGHACMHTHAHTRTHPQTCTHACTHTCTNAQTCTHLQTCTHAHTPTPRPWPNRTTYFVLHSCAKGQSSIFLSITCSCQGLNS